MYKLQIEKNKNIDNLNDLYIIERCITCQLQA